MSKKSRERKERVRVAKPDEYVKSRLFEMARYGNTTIVKNNRDESDQAKIMSLLESKYSESYQAISSQIRNIRERVCQCDPYELMSYLRGMWQMSQMNVFSEIEQSEDNNAIVIAQEYVQSIIISSESKTDTSLTPEAKEKLYQSILEDLLKLHEEIGQFYLYWSAHIESDSNAEHKHISEIFEAQLMYWVRGNRYQIFELDPVKRLLFPHDAVLREVFGVSYENVISGLDKLRYSLSQGYADAMMQLASKFDEFQALADSGLSVEKVIYQQQDKISPIISNVFGSGLIDVKSITGWDDRFIDTLSCGLNECDSFFNDSEYSGWPIIELPVARKPFLKIEEKSFAFLYYALFDNFYRNVQRGIIGNKPDYLPKWKDHQCQCSEEMVRDVFLQLMPGAEVHLGNYYPVKSSTKQMNENDIIIIYQNYLFVIEVKAGSFPNTPPITDFSAHIEAYHKLAEVADSQCSRTLDYIAGHDRAQFYDKEKNLAFELPNLSEFEDVFTFSVTVDNFNEFASKAEKLSIISLKRHTIVISYDDLLTYAGYFDSPVAFLHYLKQRKAAMQVPQFQMNDEIDHLGLYIEKNLYAHNPEQYRNVDNVVWQGYRLELDHYFGLLYTNPKRAVKPVQDIPNEIDEILNWIDKNITIDTLRIAHFLMNLSGDAKQDMARQIKYTRARQAEINCMAPIAAFGNIKYCMFISTPGIRAMSFEDQHKYVYAAASRNESIPVMWISLDYDSSNTLQTVWGRKCSFVDLDPEDAKCLKEYGNNKAKDWILLAKKKNGKIGRNEYCPCGSGKKYKFCCLKT